MGVFGSSLPEPGSRDYEQAREVGRRLARAGSAVVCGGTGGTMEAACRGASEEGGESIGVVLAGREPNAWVTHAVVAGDLSERLRRLRDLTDAWIFLPRGLGTLLELVWICESIVKGDVPARPLVLLGDFWKATAELALAEASRPEGRSALAAVVRFAASPDQAVELALEAES